MSDAVSESAYMALENTLAKLSTGEYDPLTAELVVDVIFRAFNPLMAGKEFSRTVSEVMEEISNQVLPQLIRVYSMSSGTDVVRISMIGTTVLITAKDTRREVNFETIPEAHTYILKAIDVFASKGYVKIKG